MAATTPAERKRIARLLIDRIDVTVDKESERVDATIQWAGGLVQDHRLDRPVGCYERRSDYPRLVERLRRLCEERLPPETIADLLNAEGFRPPKRTDRFTGLMAWCLASRLGLTRRERHGDSTGLGPDEYRPQGLALKLDVRRDTVRWWVRAGYATASKDEQVHYVIWADADELRRLQSLQQRIGKRSAEDLDELKKPKPRPD